MVFAPPQHGKSQLISVHLPAFWLAHRPDDPIILTSYGASLAHAKSAEAKALVESPAYANLFPTVTTDQSSRAKDYWKIAGHRGAAVAAGVGGPITGRGAALGLIDDPVENWAQAQSQTVRDATWEWYRSTFRTRIWEGGAIILVMSRWHEDDLAGRLLQDQGDQWHVLRLPALAETQEERDDNERRLGRAAGKADPLGREPGEPLCPGRYSREELESIKADVGSYVWSAAYVGAPRATEGNRFKRVWFEIVDATPAEAKRVRYWDNAATSESGCYSVGTLLTTAGDGVYFVEDVQRGQWSTDERRRIMRQTAALDRERYETVQQLYGTVDIWFEQEPGSSGVDSATDTVRDLAGFPVHADRVTGSKDVRLEPFAAQAEAGNVKLVRGDWNWDWLEEICAVPSGKYRDQADATAGAFNKLAAKVKSGRVVTAELRLR